MKKTEILGIIFFVTLWEIITKLSHNFFFPTLEIIFVDSLSKVTFGELTQNLLITIFKTLIAFLGGSILGLGLGCLVGTSFRLIGIFSFVIDFMRSLPSIVVFPLFMIIFGINETTKVIVVIFGIFWITLFGTIQSISLVSKAKIKYLKIHGATNLELLRHFIVFVLFQNWLTNLKITLTLSLFITIVLEMFIGSEYGIGKALIDAKNYYEIPVMYFWIIVAGFIGYILNKMVTKFETYFA